MGICPGRPVTPTHGGRDRFFFDGLLGVRVFFVLSGFLITHLLLCDEEKRGRLRLGNFYGRRALRILPVYFAFLLVFAILDVSTALTTRWTQYLAALTFTKNIGPSGWHDGHLWSLAVEQQFYLIWPLALLLLPPRRRFLFATLLIVSAACFRVAFYATHSMLWLNYSLLTNMDGLMFGALASMLSHSHPQLVKRITTWNPATLRLLAVVAIIGVWQLTARARLGLFTVPFGNMVQNAAAAFLIVSYSLETTGAVFRFLNHPLVSGVGVLSYSLYVWQQLFFVKDGDYAPHHPFFLHFPWNLAAVLVVAVLSFYLIERPFFTLRDRLRLRASARAT